MGPKIGLGYGLGVVVTETQRGRRGRKELE
jgi:hypothetical protein